MRRKEKHMRRKLQMDERNTKDRTKRKIHFVSLLNFQFLDLNLYLVIKDSSLMPLVKGPDW